MPRKIIIDTDPGIDDAVALLLAFAAVEELEVLGIVTVAGNVPLAQTERNARAVCELAGRRDVPVYGGCERPLFRTPSAAEHVHGTTGLGRLVLPEPTVPLQLQHGVDFLVETLRSAESGTITLGTLGPLTNIGVALVKAPDIADRVQELVMMGGAYFEVGNVTPTAEFNIHVDPHAAQLVLESGIPITMMPLDVTHKILSTRPRVARLRALGNRCGAAAADLLAGFERRRQGKLGPRGRALHDPSVIAYLLLPALFRGRELNVVVETTSSLTMGMTVVDWWRTTGRPANVRFVHEVDAEGFFDLLNERLAILP